MTEHQKAAWPFRTYSKRFVEPGKGAPCTRSPGRATYSRAWNASHPKTTPNALIVTRFDGTRNAPSVLCPTQKSSSQATANAITTRGRKTVVASAPTGPPNSNSTGCCLRGFLAGDLARAAGLRAGDLARGLRAGDAARAPPADWRRVATISATCFWLLAAM